MVHQFDVGNNHRDDFDSYLGPSVNGAYAIGSEWRPEPFRGADRNTLHDVRVDCWQTYDCAGLSPSRNALYFHPYRELVWPDTRSGDHRVRTVRRFSTIVAGHK